MRKALVLDLFSIPILVRLDGVFDGWLYFPLIYKVWLRAKVYQIAHDKAEVLSAPYVAFEQRGNTWTRMDVQRRHSRSRPT